jgi:multiple sugar transport system substrate-binding protein
MIGGKQSKKLLGLLLAFSLLVPILAACTAPAAAPAASQPAPAPTTAPAAPVAQPTAAPAAASGEQITLDFWNPETNDAMIKVLQEDIAAYEKLHPNIKVNLVNIPWGDIYTKWQTGIQSKAVPDLSISSAAFGTSFNEQGALEPLDDVVKDLGGEENFFAPTAKSFVAMNKKNGSFFAMPNVLNSVVLWYNKDLLKKAGLEPPKTWDEFLNAAKALTKDGVYGTLVTSSKTHVTQHTLYSLMLTNGADIVDRETGNKVVFDSPETVETLAYYKELSKYSPPGATGYDRPEAQAAMTTGKIAMWIYGSWLSGALREAGEDVFNQFGVAPVPTKKGNGAFMGNTSYIVFKDAKHKAEAKDFLKFLMQDQQYIKWLLTDPAGQGPVSKSAQQNPAYTDSPDYKAVKHVIDASNQSLPSAWVYGMPNPHAGEIEGLQVISEVAAKVVVDNEDPAQAAKEGAAKIEEIINKK